MTAHRRRLAYFAWGAVCLIWGTTYLGIRVSLESIPPALMGGIRWLVAGSLLTAYLVARGRPLPPTSQWGGIALLGFLMLGLGNGGVVFAEQWVPSGLAAVMVATSPFWMATVEACLPDGERLRRSVVAGLVIGFSGIVLLVWPDLTRGSAEQPWLSRRNRGASGRVDWLVDWVVGTRGGTAARQRQPRPNRVVAPTQVVSMKCWERPRIRCWRAA